MVAQLGPSRSGPAPQTLPKYSKNASATQPLFFIDFGTRFDDIFKVFGNFLYTFRRQCRQFLPASCFKIVGFHGQHLKVSAVALQLQSADTGRCQAFQTKEASIAKRRLRRLALLTSRRPPGESKWLQKSHFSRPFSVSNFGIIFGMPFFRHFTPFGAPLAPLWLLLGILDAFWPPFWLPFGSLLLQICIPFSNLVFASILH